MGKLAYGKYGSWKSFSFFDFVVAASSEWTSFELFPVYIFNISNLILLLIVEYFSLMSLGFASRSLMDMIEFAIDWIE